MRIQALPAALFLAALPRAQVILHEVLYDPAGTDMGLERIELKNLGTQTENLAGWSVAVCYPGTLLNNRTYWPFGPGFKIDPGQIVTLHYLEAGIDTNDDFYTGTASSSFLCVTPPKNLDNATGSVALFDTTNCALFSSPQHIQDFVQWGGSTYHETQAGAAGIWPFATSFKDVAEGRSIAAIGPGDSPEFFFEDKSPTIGLPNEAPGAPQVMSYGTGCAGSAGTPKLDTQGGLPAMGNQSFQLRLQDALPGASAVVGMSTDPGPFALFGCTLEIDPAALVLVLGPKVVSAAGHALFSLPVPDDASLLGVPFYYQGSVIDPGSPSGIAAFSNGVLAGL
jgi:hypothetical protein